MRRTNLLQLTFESWIDDPVPPASGGNVLTAVNIKRICDTGEALLASTNFDKFCFKPAGMPECMAPYSLCQFMSPTVSKEYAINVPTQMPINPADPSAGMVSLPADSALVQGMAIGQLFTPTGEFALDGMSMYQIVQYAPPVAIPAELAMGLLAMMADAKVTDSATCEGTATDATAYPDCAEAYAAAAAPTTFSAAGCPAGCTYTPGEVSLSGNADYGACTGWGSAVTNAAGDAYTSISFTGCSIPDGNGPLLTTDAEILQIATNLKNSDDYGAKNYLLTADFLDGVSDQVSATKMRIFTGIPYDKEPFDLKYDLTAKTKAECEAFFNDEDREIPFETCEGPQFWLASEGPPNKFRTYDDPAYGDDEATNKEKSIEWWHVLNCGRLLLSYNAQCVEDLNKVEMQALFVTYADNDLFPLLNDKMMNGEAPYDYSGPDGELRIYFTEFSRLIQVYFDSKVGMDGAKALFAMIFSYMYICFHTQDFGLSTVGMIHIMITVPVSLSVYLGPFGFGTFNTLCPLGIFVILGIGADDIFIVVDMWKQSLRYFDEDDLSGRMAWTWQRSAHAMLTTTLTTAAAFMANGMSPIPPIAVFGIFTALLVLINYVFCITWFPAMIILKERGAFGYWIPAYCGCCGLCFPISYFMYKKATDDAPICGEKEQQSDAEDPQTMKDKASSLKDKAAAKAQELKDKASDAMSKEEPKQKDPLALMTKTETFFYEKFAPFVDQSKIPIIAGFSVLSLIFFIFAVQLEPAKEAAQFIPDSDPIQRNLALVSDPEMQVFKANEQQQFVNIFFGQESINRDDTDFLNMADYGILKTADSFEATIASADAQEKFMSVCDRLRNANDPSGAGAFVRRIDNEDGEVYCVFEDFKRWLVDVKGENYPGAFTTECTGSCKPVEKFRYLISEFSNFLRLRGLPSLGKTSYIQAFGNTYSDTLRFDIKSEVPCSDGIRQLSCRPLIMVQLYFNTTFKFNSPANIVDPAYEALDVLTDEIVAGTCSVADQYTSADCTAAGGNWVGTVPGMYPRHTANRYVGVNTEKVLLSSAVWGTVFSLCLAAVMILAATNNYLVTGWSLLVIILVVNAVVGTMVIMGWTLGVVESICLTICVGLSVDYTIHLCHVFATSSATTRFAAGRDALASMGVSVFNAAITTIGSSIVLMLSYIIFFQRFGIFVFMNIFYSTAFAFIFLMGILMLIGPIQGAGRIMKKGGDGGSGGGGATAGGGSSSSESVENPSAAAAAAGDDDEET
jgi:hypothetical protein